MASCPTQTEVVGNRKYTFCWKKTRKYILFVLATIKKHWKTITSVINKQSRKQMKLNAQGWNTKCKWNNKIGKRDSGRYRIWPLIGGPHCYNGRNSLSCLSFYHFILHDICLILSESYEVTTTDQWKPTANRYSSDGPDIVRNNGQLKSDVDFLDSPTLSC